MFGSQVHGRGALILSMPGSIPHRERSTQRARPLPTRQNSRFWMPATNRTVIVSGVPNGGGVRGIVVITDHAA
jgi:hypothetical protein